MWNTSFLCLKPLVSQNVLAPFSVEHDLRWQLKLIVLTGCLLNGKGFCLRVRGSVAVLEILLLGLI